MVILFITTLQRFYNYPRKMTNILLIFDGTKYSISYITTLREEEERLRLEEEERLRLIRYRDNLIISSVDSSLSSVHLFLQPTGSRTIHW